MAGMTLRDRIERIFEQWKLNGGDGRGIFDWDGKCGDFYDLATDLAAALEKEGVIAPEADEAVTVEVPR